MMHAIHKQTKKKKTKKIKLFTVLESFLKLKLPKKLRTTSLEAQR
jgi:hypothetical protein